MQAPIEHARRRVGEPPRRWSWWERVSYLHLRRPFWVWVDEDEDLNQLFSALPDIVDNGDVVWGHVVQANANLFEPGKSDHPGEVVFSPHAPGGGDPELLADVAARLFDLKNTEPGDPKLATIAAHLTNEMTRLFGSPVPAKLCGDSPTYLSTTFFARKHLPGRVLHQQLLPLLVSRADPYHAMPLPARYWAPDFVQWWCAS